jgi:hypothetical protein
MLSVLKLLVKQPYWVIALVLGVVLVSFPCVTIDKEHHWQSHSPNTYWPVGVGVALLLLSSAAFWLSLRSKDENGAGAGLDLTRVKEKNGVLWTKVGSCEIRIVNGRIEDYPLRTGAVMVLPCNEYFDDRCASDDRSALGAYVKRNFDGQAPDFVTLIKNECRKTYGAGVVRRKTSNESAESFGAGRCVLLEQPLNRSVPIALISTTTQRADHGLAAQISYLFDGMQELVRHLANSATRLNEVAMPILGAGHGGIDAPRALVGLLLAITEAVGGQGGQCLKRATIVVFRPDAGASPIVDPVVVRRALALIGSKE